MKGREGHVRPGRYGTAVSGTGKRLRTQGPHTAEQEYSRFGSGPQGWALSCSGKGQRHFPVFPEGRSCACGKGNGAAIGGSSPRFRMGREKSAPAGRPREYWAGSGAAGYDRGGMCRLDAQHAAHQGRINGGRFRASAAASSQARQRSCQCSATLTKLLTQVPTLVSVSAARGSVPCRVTPVSSRAARVKPWVWWKKVLASSSAAYSSSRLRAAGGPPR